MVRLAPVLHSGDLPLAELCAARLDGELVGLDAAFVPVDTAVGPGERAAAVGRLWPPRLIAEQCTAAWIWGARLLPPPRHQLCASLDRRARPPEPERSVLREVVIDADEIVVAGGVPVTAPLRTLVDLARFSPLFDSDARSTIANLAVIGRITIDDCRAALDRRRNLPAKRLAWARIREVLEARPDGDPPGISRS
jgi:hypothetical protein